MTAPERVDVAGSHARRVDGSVHLVLLLPDLEIEPGPAVVRLRDGERTLRRPARASRDADGARLELALPAARLGHGVWRLAVRPAPEASFTRIEARLLTGRRQPVALLPGPAPETRMPAPEPAAPEPSPALRPVPARGSRSGLQRRARRLVARLRRAGAPLTRLRGGSRDGKERS